MFEQVIVGVGRPEEAPSTIAHARAIAPHAHFTLANVYPFAVAGRIGQPGDDRPSGYELSLRQERTDMLAAVRGVAGSANAELVTLGGPSPARALRTLAADRGADLLVVGPSHHSAVGRIVLGDVARGVLRGADCPVLVVPRGKPRRELAVTVGVAFDRSPQSQLALHAAVELSRDLHCTLDLVDAIDLGTLPETWESGDGVRAQDLRRGVELALRELAAGLPVPALVEARLGTPKAVLGPLSRRVDLVVCGSRSWGPVARVTLGSTSDWLIHHAQSSVLVVPSAAEAVAELPVAQVASARG